jgi:cytoskeletal protein CcmA (bactofilin family)
MFKSKSTLNELAATSTTIIGAGTTITGNVQSNGDIRIDGIIKGNLEAKAKIIIGASGLVEGDIDGKQADVLGAVTGKIKVTELLCLHGKAIVNGDIFAGNLQIETSATFNGKCHMGTTISEYKAVEKKEANSFDKVALQ